MSRIGKLTEYIFDIIYKNYNEKIIELWAVKCANSHLYGVSYMAALIAAKRGDNVELATMAGMLHDIAYFAPIDSPAGTHAELGSIISMKILKELNITSPEENEIICSAIKKHSDKDVIDMPFDEILKDADLLAHGIGDVTTENKDLIGESRERRWIALCKEFGFLNYENLRSNYAEQAFSIYKSYN